MNYKQIRDSKSLTSKATWLLKKYRRGKNNKLILKK